MTGKDSAVRDVRFHVRKYDPAQDPEPYVHPFKVPVKPGMTVLEGLWYIKENLDPALAWRVSCRMGVCGSCGMLLNGRPMLACNTQVLDIAERDLSVGPLPNFRILKDLAPDLAPMFDKHRALQPFVLGPDEAELNDPAGEYYQSPAELEDYLQFSLCIRCGCCMGACPTLATDLSYLGPMPLAQAYRYNVDTRDGAREKRAALAGGPHGAFRCHYAGECSRACPKGVDPARAIQHLKRQLVLDYLRLGRRKEHCAKQHGPGKVPRGPGVPDAPPYTLP